MSSISATVPAGATPVSLVASIPSVPEPIDPVKALIEFRSVNPEPLPPTANQLLVSVSALPKLEAIRDTNRAPLESLTISLAE